MRTFLVAMFALWAGCAADRPDRPPNDLDEACERHVCPADPPEFINCGPIVEDDLLRVCGECMAFLRDTCEIEFVF